MAKQRAKIQFVVELDALEIKVPSQAEGLLLVKNIQKAVRASVRKALGVPKEDKLLDIGFTGVLSGQIEGQEGSGFILDTFGVEVEDENDSENLEEEGVTEDGTSDKTPGSEAPKAETQGEEVQVPAPVKPKFGARKPAPDANQ